MYKMIEHKTNKRINKKYIHQPESSDGAPDHNN